jgi:beta-glucosidase
MSRSLARRFPPGFLFGTATAAYQIEGGHDADGKGPSIWDTFCLRPGAISTGETGEIACDHYHRWREDVALMREIGLGAYRLSISWPRVIPSGTGAQNEKGLAFYDRLVDELLANGIRPFVTLYHWDLPQALQERGGWAAREIVDQFAAYADLVARRLGDRVKDWMTLNEPEVVAYAGHHVGVHAPGVRDFRTAVLVSHHLLLAHRAGAEAIRAARPAARVGIALNMSPCEPATDSPEDAAAALRADGYLNRWFLDPLYGRGYPKDMVKLYEPYFDRARELDGYHGRLDFLGVNYYTRRLTKAGDGPLQLDRVERDGVERTAIGWEVHPASFRKILVRVHRDYAPREMFVTENGAAYDDIVDNDIVDDPTRVSFLSRHFLAAAEAIGDGVPLRGYFIWTLMDNFEWAHGTSKRFGIVHTDYRTQRRRIKSSGHWYRELIAAHREANVSAVAT